ncbi:MAG: formyltetrahydrofolate deformylase [Psychromonas sp.]|nr:formyltetrahydrofolate deformylase [Psychromonas sp.]
MEKKILLTDCPDCKGLIAQITNICQNQHLNIIKNNEFVDKHYGRFFMRTVIEGEFDDEKLLADLDLHLPEGSDRRLISSRNKRVVVLVTKEAHCIGDILMKSLYGGMDVEVCAVVSNYNSLEELVSKFDVPFHAIVQADLSREEHEDKILEVIAEYKPDYVILAKYMRILTPNFVAKYKNKLINIHHSFLPAFIGAKAYEQAFDRGVKMIGATAHFVNEHLDDGAIISQDIAHIDHAYNAEELAKAGRDVERSVLSRALQQVLGDKVFVYKNRTVVFK